MHPFSSETVLQIESMPMIAADQILLALSAEGVQGAVVGVDPCLEVSVRGSDVASLSQRVLSALDRLVLDQGRSLIPERVGPLSYFVHPPAA
jgi:hypothetical protein